MSETYLFRYLSIQKQAVVVDAHFDAALSLCEVLIKHDGEFLWNINI